MCTKMADKATKTKNLSVKCDYNFFEASLKTYSSSQNKDSVTGLMTLL